MRDTVILKLGPRPLVLEFGNTQVGMLSDTYIGPFWAEDDEKEMI